MFSPNVNKKIGGHLEDVAILGMEIDGQGKNHDLPSLKGGGLDRRAQALKGTGKPENT
ncbi:uncharacterized protein DS421_10g300040 [Arachis hypogaea]|nr:uncharacterized protein DS421_10g300040 [Arachis hypogaea]